MSLSDDCLIIYGTGKSKFVVASETVIPLILSKMKVKTILRGRVLALLLHICKGSVRFFL